MGGFLLKGLQAFTFLTSSACPLEWQFPSNHISQQHQKLHDTKTRCKPSAEHVVASSDGIGNQALHRIPKLKFLHRLTHIIYIWMHWLISYHLHMDALIDLIWSSPSSETNPNKKQQSMRSSAKIKTQLFWTKRGLNQTSVLLLCYASNLQ